MASIVVAAWANILDETAAERLIFRNPSLCNSITVSRAQELVKKCVFPYKFRQTDSTGRIMEPLDRPGLDFERKELLSSLFRYRSIVAQFFASYVSDRYCDGHRGSR